jgi:hypothetical protein
VGKTVNVAHHTRRTMEDLEEVSKELLGPTTNLVDRPDIFQNLLDGAAIAEPEEFGAPKKFPILAYSPVPASSLADKRMVVAFVLGTTPRTETNGTQAGTVHSKVKGTTCTLGTEEGKSNPRSFRVIWLHEDPTHAATSPVSLQKTRQRRVITGKARRRSNTQFHFVPKLHYLDAWLLRIKTARAHKCIDDKRTLPIIV